MDYGLFQSNHGKSGLHDLSTDVQAHFCGANAQTLYVSLAGLAAGRCLAGSM